MRATLVLLLASAALLSICSAQDLDNCNLSDPTGLSRCLKGLLISARPKIAQEADPLSLANFEDGDVKGSDIVIRGIAGYRVGQLSVSFPADRQVAVHATIAWPRIKGNLKAEVRKCKKILWKRICIRVRGRPEVTVGRTVGSLNTTLNVVVASNGQISVRARGTSVSLNLASIRIKANLRGVLGLFNRLFGDPASRITTRLANKWWRNNKSKIENKAKRALEKVVKEKLSLQLSRLLKLG